jgi:uncharacterized membrane-anchored protein
MSDQPLKDLIQSASARGLLPADAAPEDVTRPWPIVLMSGLGAWLAVLPLIVVMFMIFGDALEKGVLAYFLGGVFLYAAVGVLRRRGTSDFVAQLGLPAMLVGGALLAFGLYRDMPYVPAGALLTLIIVAVTWLVPHNWLRVLLGALACSTFILTMSGHERFESPPIWNGVHLALIVWLGALVLVDTRHVAGAQADRLIAVESASTGWCALALLALAMSSGETFMIGASLGPWRGTGIASALLDDPLRKTVSLGLAIGGAAWIAYRWPTLRHAHMLLAATLLAALSWLIPTLGGTLMVLAVCIAGGRLRLAVAGAIAAAWVIGTFYYQLNFPLATKAAILTCMGGAFGLLAWLSWRRQHPAAPAAAAIASDGRWRQAGIAMSLVLILVVANSAIWQKEVLISTGRPVFIELAPVDPRSLMQGDYMALNFHLPELDDADSSPGRRVKMVARIDAKGVAVMRGIDAGKPLAPDEILIELLRTGRGLRPASDAWYFKEGEADRWAKAKFGEFRIDGDGRALLVDLRGPDMEKL